MRPPDTRAPRGAPGLLFLIALFGASLAHAQASRVVLLRGSGEAALVKQAETLLAGELRAAGFEVVTTERGAGDVRGALEAASARLRPVATVAMLPVNDAGAVDLWVLDSVTGKRVIRRIELSGARDEGTSAASLALRAVELLRGSLLEVTIDRPVASPAPPADVARLVAAAGPERRLYFVEGIGVGVGASLLGGSSLGAAWAPVVRLSWGHRRGLGARVSLLGPGSARSVERREGRATVNQELLLVEGVMTFRPRAALQPFVAAGGGAYRARARGTGASSLFPDDSASALGAALSAGAGVALRLGRHAAVLADAQALLTMPESRVLIADQVAARMGVASFLGSLGLLTTF